jgi:glycosyltransferase involved in cell wall biosynthesis
MRIVFLAYAGSVHSRRWVSFFAGHGHEVHLITCGGSEAMFGCESSRCGVSRYRVHDLGAPRPGRLGYLAKVMKVRAIVRALQPDVLHAHYATSYGLLGLVSSCRPFVVTAHGDDVLTAPQNPFMRPVVRAVLRSADLITVPAHHVGAAARDLMAPVVTPMEAFQYGVDTEQLAARGGGRRARSSRSDVLAPVAIVSARPLLKSYRVDALLRALAVLRARGTQFRCDIAGDGTERSVLEALTATLGLSSTIRFLGHLSSPELEEVMARSDVYVSLAESDGASLALLEAMALGVIPVLSNIPANRAWISDGESGALVEIDALAVADGIERAAAMDRDKAAELNLIEIRARADRHRNLSQFESRLAALVEARAAGAGVR